MVGTAAVNTSSRGLYRLSAPMSRGIVTNWTDMERIWYVDSLLFLSLYVCTCRKNSKSDLKKSDLKIGIRWNPLVSVGIRWNPWESVKKSVGTHWNPLESDVF